MGGESFFDDFMSVIMGFWDFVVANQLETALLGLGGLLVLMILVAILLRRRRKNGGARVKGKPVDSTGAPLEIASYHDVTYMQLPLLTATEIKFWGLLYQAAPGCYIFPQVAVSAILTIQSESYEHFWEVIKKYQNCRVDFVVCDAQLSIIALVELDDQTNERRRTKDAEQDYITAQAGYKTVRFNRKDWPTAEQVKARIFSNN
jgi:Uncharacterized protein conserved in bacteria